MSGIQDAIAQKIWECYVMETGSSMPEGMADRMAARVVAVVSSDDKLTQIKTQCERALDVMENDGVYHAEDLADQVLAIIAA
jgi:phosphoribosylamine-glycine ligase